MGIGLCSPSGRAPVANTDREDGPVTLFSDENPTLQGEQEPARVAPSRRVIIGWVSIGVAVVLALVLALVPAPFVIEQPGPVFNTLGTDQEVGAAPGKDAKQLITIPGQKT